jgi:5'-nucleotidase
MRILLTNDDGIHAPGIRAMHAALIKAGHVVHVVAPITEQSAVGHALTMSLPLRVKEIRENGFVGLGVSGTPVDSVKLGLTALVEDKPELIVSGINSGANVGVDILYSGTVSAATEGALMGFPALAVSVDEFNPVDLAEQADWCAALIVRIPWHRVPEKCVLNLNFPKGPFREAKGLRLCPHTKVPYNDWYEKRTDPRGRTYYWLNGVIPPGKVSPGRDRSLLSDGHITLTPLRFDFTDRETLSVLESVLGRP